MSKLEKHIKAVMKKQAYWSPSIDKNVIQDLDIISYPRDENEILEILKKDIQKLLSRNLFLEVKNVAELANAIKNDEKVFAERGLIGVHDADEFDFKIISEWCRQNNIKVK